MSRLLQMPPFLKSGVVDASASNARQCAPADSTVRRPELNDRFCWRCCHSEIFPEWQLRVDCGRSTGDRWRWPMLRRIRRVSARSRYSRPKDEWLLSGAAVRHDAARGTSTAWEAVRLPPATSRLRRCPSILLMLGRVPTSNGAGEMTASFTRYRSNALLGNEFCTEIVPLCKNR